MANIKSAKKRILVNRTKADRNKAIKSGVKTAIKKKLNNKLGIDENRNKEVETDDIVINESK